MLSDEMTTGGLSSGVNDKRIFAAKSHAWNISQKRFREAFPDVCDYHELLSCGQLTFLPALCTKHEGIA